MSVYSISGERGHFAISGELGFDTVNGLLQQSRDTLFADASARLELELGGVTRVDSAGLALLIEWMRMARSGNQAIYFHNLPEQLLAIARAGEVDSLLPTVD